MRVHRGDQLEATNSVPVVLVLGIINSTYQEIPSQDGQLIFRKERSRFHDNLLRLTHRLQVQLVQLIRVVEEEAFDYRNRLFVCQLFPIHTLL